MPLDWSSLFNSQPQTFELELSNQFPDLDCSHPATHAFGLELSIQFPALDCSHPATHAFGLELSI